MSSSLFTHHFYPSDSSCLILSLTTISARSGMTSQAMFFTTWSDINCTTRRAIRSTCSSVRSPEGAAAADAGWGAGSPVHRLR